MKLVTPPLTSIDILRNRLEHSTVLSPVNQNGSFEFDRVIKSGDIQKRTRKTKTWKSMRIVLRPNTVSLYKDQDETKLRHQINLSEVTAVARQNDPKGKELHVFGLFSPSRNFHLAANTEREAQEWVELIRNEARIDEYEEDMIVMSPGGTGCNIFQGFERQLESRRDIIASSSSEAEFGQQTGSTIPPNNVYSARRPSHNLIYSGNEHGSFSDFSDAPAVGGFRTSAMSLSNNGLEGLHTHARDGIVNDDDDRPTTRHNASQVSGVGGEPDSERVVCHGWLYLLKSKGGVRQWKKVWVVLRPKTLALYKNEEEYSASLIIAIPSIITAVEIDPISRSKCFCMQVITEERNYRFCAIDDDSLANWLGALKSLFAKRKELGKEFEGDEEKPPSSAQGGLH